MQISNNLAPVSHQLRQDVLSACKIIVDQKLDSGPFGNISIRIPNTEAFWINPAGITFDQLELDDILCVDTFGNILEGKHEPHPGTFIHREIYRLRMDIGAIVHTHSENTVMISLLGCEIQSFTQLGTSIYNDQSIYHGFNGPVRTTDEGFVMAQALGKKSILIAKNHGVFTCGATIQSALWDFIIADMAAKTHLTANSLGIHSADMPPKEIIQKSKIEVRQKQCEFMWNSYLKRNRFR